MPDRNNLPQCAHWHHYTECSWGDLIVATKEQMLALGIGQGRAFPGELGCPPSGLKTHDHRGFAVAVSIFRRSDTLFEANVIFPNWPKEKEPPVLATNFPGVTKRELVHCDEFLGTAEALENAGLLRSDLLPGKPGMPIGLVKVRADGQLARRATKAARAEDAASGLKTTVTHRIIRKATKGRYTVDVYLDEATSDERHAAYKKEQSRWIAELRAANRPARLSPKSATSAAATLAAQSAAARDLRLQGFLGAMLKKATRRENEK